MNYTISIIYRKLDSAELENAALKDPTVYSNRAKMKRFSTIGTSGKFLGQGTTKTASQSTLLSSINIIESDEIKIMNHLLVLEKVDLENAI